VLAALHRAGASNAQALPQKARWQWGFQGAWSVVRNSRAARGMLGACAGYSAYDGGVLGLKKVEEVAQVEGWQLGGGTSGRNHTWTGHPNGNLGIVSSFIPDSIQYPYTVCVYLAVPRPPRPPPPPPAATLSTLLQGHSCLSHYHLCLESFNRCQMARCFSCPEKCPGDQYAWWHHCMGRSSSSFRRHS